jgi:hypothetical protein
MNTRCSVRPCNMSQKRARGKEKSIVSEHDAIVGKT